MTRCGSGYRAFGRVVAAGESGLGGQRGWRTAVVPRSRAALSRDPIRSCPVMSQLNIEAFRALTMIVASFGPYLAISVRDHEGPTRGRFLKLLALSSYWYSGPSTSIGRAAAGGYLMDKYEISG
jgi:hypothetical protein